MVVAMVSQVMHELVAARYEHQVARQANSKLADTDQILKIVHLPEEREKQKQVRLTTPEGPKQPLLTSQGRQIWRG
ncbi:hypothetical protein T484DRAFT_2754847 [Baffinella frigidus]|nr:hypothetical protein T484DRAFT_2754847 [Cryptophyta sp. CCMP2293]